jgi:hypothetical protein
MGMLQSPQWVERGRSCRTVTDQERPVECCLGDIAMQLEQKSYRAMIWETPSSIGKRVTVIAKSLDDARLKLEAEYGEGAAFDLHNERDASTPR